MEATPPAFNQNIASRYGLGLSSFASRLGVLDVFRARTTSQHIEVWFCEAIRDNVWLRRPFDAGPGTIELNYAQSSHFPTPSRRMGPIVEAWVTGYFIIHDNPRTPLFPNTHNLGCLLILRAIPIQYEWVKVLVWCYTPYLFGLYSELATDAHMCWEISRPEQNASPSLPPYLTERLASGPRQPEVGTPNYRGLIDHPQKTTVLITKTASIGNASASSEVANDPELDNQAAILKSNTSTSLSITSASARNSSKRGPKFSYDYQSRREIILGWLEVQDTTNQVIYCNNHSISRDALQDWMRKMPEVISEFNSRTIPTSKAG